MQTGRTIKFAWKPPGDYLMEQSDLLRHVCTVLENLGLSYLITGSQAAIAFGEPRFTNDIDIVVSLGLDPARCVHNVVSGRRVLLEP
jgi:hypothetical protein